MSDAKTALIRSLVHTVEVALALAVGLFLIYMFREDADVMKALKDLLLSLIGCAVAIVPVFGAKFIREWKGSGVPDYVQGIGGK